MKSPEGTGCGIILLPVPAQENAFNERGFRKNRREKSSGSSGREPVLFLNMTNGDLYIRGDGASCLYVRKDPDDPAAMP